MEPSKPIVELTGITRRFGTIQALRGVSLNLYPGEVHAIVGENGAGKSTLVKILAGIHQPDSGLIQVDGQDVELQTPAQAQQLGIAVIHQEPTLFPDLDVAENIFMGRHPRDRLGRINWRQMYREVEQLLTTLGVHLSVYAPVRGLSVADQQLVEIAKALSVEARVLVMDEPTAALSPHEVQQLFTIINQLRRRGTAILFISHRLDEVFALADRITILRDGACITSALASELTLASTIRHMVGRELGALFPKEAAEIGEVVLDVRHLTRRGVFEDISFQVRQGEIVGFAGLIGSGRTEVARVLFGIGRPDSGEIWICGQRISVRSPQQAMQHGIAYVPEDRHTHGLILPFPITSNVSLTTPRQVSSFGLVSRRREQQLAGRYSRQLDIRAAGLDQLAQALSGGNQQKVVLAKWLATSPRVLILDEPTRGVDIGAKAEVHRIISRLATQGMAILLISSELPEVLAMSDRVLVMHEGRITRTFTHNEVTQEQIMFAATGQVFYDRYE